MFAPEFVAANQHVLIKVMKQNEIRRWPVTNPPWRYLQGLGLAEKMFFFFLNQVIDSEGAFLKP